MTRLVNNSKASAPVNHTFRLVSSLAYAYSFLYVFITLLGMYMKCRKPSCYGVAQFVLGSRDVRYRSEKSEFFNTLFRIAVGRLRTYIS